MEKYHFTPAILLFYNLESFPLENNFTPGARTKWWLGHEIVD